MEGDCPLTAAEEQALFRIAQEALNNVVKVVVLQAVALHLALPPLAQFALVTLVAVPLTFWLVGLVKKPRRRVVQATATLA